MVDTHAHLDFCSERAADLVTRARGAGVRRILTVGTDPTSDRHALQAAFAYEPVYCALGRHPHETAGFGPDDLAELERLAGHRKVRAIGETGLDFYRDRAPREDQRRAFVAQIELAGRLGLPLVVHTRAAEEETFDILRDHAGGLTVILHCFSAPDRLQDCIARGYMCSFAGNVTYKKATDLQEAARQVPAELLLVETDSPYLSPQAVRGEPNQPANVRSTAEFIARLRGIAYRELERIVEDNARRVLRW